MPMQNYFLLPLMFFHLASLPFFHLPFSCFLFSLFLPYCLPFSSLTSFPFLGMAPYLVSSLGSELMPVLPSNTLPESNTVPGSNLVNISLRMNIEPHLTLTADTEGLVTLGTCCLQLFTLIYEAKGALCMQEHKAIQGTTCIIPVPPQSALLGRPHTWAHHKNLGSRINTPSVSFLWNNA